MLLNLDSKYPIFLLDAYFSVFVYYKAVDGVPFPPPQTSMLSFQFFSIKFYKLFLLYTILSDKSYRFASKHGE